MYYFPHTKGKDWDVIDAFCAYDKEFSDLDPLSILKIMESALIQFEKAQASLRKYVFRVLDNVKKLLSLNCVKENTLDDTDPNEQIPHEEASENFYSNKPSGSIPNVTNRVKIAKFSGNFVNGGVQYVDNRLHDISNVTPSADKLTSVILTEGSKKYRITTPDHKSDNLHQPKIRKVQLIH
ncbi:hypothetical protein BD408DRAFT_166663 [Parasitella parasitica]|nr:hypothetical protein BD408DRAFT_166663 [Parasitella parasitica]